MSASDNIKQKRIHWKILKFMKDVIVSEYFCIPKIDFCSSPIPLNPCLDFEKSTPYFSSKKQLRQIMVSSKTKLHFFEKKKKKKYYLEVHEWD